MSPLGKGHLAMIMVEKLDLVHCSSRLIVICTIVASYTAHLIVILGVLPGVVGCLLGSVFGNVFLISQYETPTISAITTNL